MDVFTQGETVDEVIANLKEAVALHLEGVNPSEYGFCERPSLLIITESEPQYAL